MTRAESEKRRFNPGSALSSITLGCSLLVLLLLGARQFTSYDLGYHLAFGETFFTTGKIVDYTPYVYTLPAQDVSATERPAAGPGCWYDSEGHYRFPNANWLSQLFIYGSWYLGGAAGLNLLQIFILAGLAVMLILALRKSGVPLYFISPALLLLGLIINSRLNIRPELFGYLCLMAQYLLLAGPAIQAEWPNPPSWKWVTAMILIQLVSINVHSYFLLGLAITGTVLTEYFFSALKKRLIDGDIQGFRTYRQVTFRLAITLGGMVLVSFINPWGWRLALLPIQTLLFLRRHEIGGESLGADSHPWDNIIEFRGTIYEGWPLRLSDYAVMIMLAIAALAIALQLIAFMVKLRQDDVRRGSTNSLSKRFRVRWAHFLMICGMLFVGLQMRRNIGVASLIIIPSALICVADVWRYFTREKLKNNQGRLLLPLNAVVLLLAVLGGYLVLNGRVYTADALPTRFGLGLNDTYLPLGASKWLSSHAPDARVWTDFQTSSTVHFFTEPHTAVPILTNTWAYPPEVMAENLYYCRAKTPFSSLADKYGIDAVVLRPSWTLPLHRQLGESPEWKMVHAEGLNVLFLRADNQYSSLAGKFEIRPGNFDPESFAVQAIKKNTSFKQAVLDVADTLNEAGETDLAIDLVEAGIKHHQPNLQAWEKLLDLYSYREVQRRQNQDKRVINDIKRMKYILEQMLELAPGNKENIARLEYINRILSVIEGFPEQK